MPTLAQDPRLPRPAAFAFLALAQTPDEIGRLGRFRVLKLLGEGGMGMVFLADDPDLDRRVALKVMKPDAARHEEGRMRFLREARTAAAVEHDNVVAILQVGEDGGVPFLVMPLLKGESLESRLQRSPKLPAAEAARLGREASEGLAAAHAAGLVHRDIKPSNLWLEQAADGRERVKVLDFGLARPVEGGERLTQTNALLGTAGYMAPEQARAEAVDGRADLFSLGCVLYRICTGQAPFRGATLTAVLTQLATYHPPPPHDVAPAVPAALSDLVMRLLMKDPASRPASARQVADALRAMEPALRTDAGPLPATSSPTAETITAAVALTTPAGPIAPASPTSQRRTLRFAVPIVLISCAALVLSAILLSPLRARLFPLTGPAGASPDASPAVIPATPAGFKGYIDVIVYDPMNPQRQNVRLNAPEVLPLKPGDRFAVEAEMNPPAYLYILWINGDGSVDPLYPWKPGHWEPRPAEEQPVGRLRRPEAVDRWFTIKESTPGMETLVLLARETPLPADADLRAELGPLRPQTLQALQATVWFENGMVVKDEPGRKADFNEEKLDDPVTATQEQIRSRLGRWFPYTRAVSFADRGK